VRNTKAALKARPDSRRRAVAAAIAVSVLAHALLFIGLPGPTASVRAAQGRGRIVFQAGPAAAAGAIAVPVPAAAIRPKVHPTPAPNKIDASERTIVSTEVPAAAGNGVPSGGSDDRAGTQDPAAGYRTARERFIALLAARKTYPALAREKGIEGNVGLSVRLDVAGSPESVSVRRSSGSGLLDDAALALVRRCLPFPHGLGRELVLEISIAYRLED
jgi:TonB family protein